MTRFTRANILSTFEASMARVTLKELRLRNYRAFADARLVIDDVTFLVGRNGAGKSTLMDAFSFVSEAVTDSLGTVLERRGNFLGLFPRDLRRAARQGVSVAVCLDRESKSPVLYGFTVGWRNETATQRVSGPCVGGHPPDRREGLPEPAPDIPSSSAQAASTPTPCLRQLERARGTGQSGPVGARPNAVQTPIRLDGSVADKAHDRRPGNDGTPASDSRGRSHGGLINGLGTGSYAP